MAVSTRESVDALTSISPFCPFEFVISKLAQLKPGGAPAWDVKRKRWHLNDGYKEPPLPPEDCLAPPGPGKVPTMVRRYERGFAIMVPLILFFDQNGRFLGTRGDSRELPRVIGKEVATAMDDRHWNGSIIHKAYRLLNGPTEVELTREEEIEERLKIEEDRQARINKKRAMLERTAKGALQRSTRTARILLIMERHELMKSKGSDQLMRPIEAMRNHECPTCGAAPGKRCKGGRIHKMRRKPRSQK